MKRSFLGLLGFGLFAASDSSQGAEDARLKQIAREFDKREGLNGPDVGKHRAWSLTEAGKADLVYLAEHYDDLSDQRKYELPLELARTGTVGVVPLVKRALDDPDGSVFSGIFYACRLGGFDPEYGKQIAPCLIPLLGRKHLGEDRALKLLPTLDPDLAGKTLFTDAWLSPDAPEARSVLRAFNEANQPVPVERVRPLMEKWRARALADGERKDQWAYAAALTALARSDAADAVAKADEWIAKYPQETEDVAGVFLVASGLTGLFDSLVDRIDSPKDMV